jgi:hypothetical protein
MEETVEASPGSDALASSKEKYVLSSVKEIKGWN